MKRRRLQLSKEYLDYYCRPTNAVGINHSALDSMILGSKARSRMRSDSMSIINSSAELGTSRV